MLNIDLRDRVLADAPRITVAISTGAQWEIWMQVELMVLLSPFGVGGAREVPYPPPHPAWHLDALLRDPAGKYAIELKVESATNSGEALLAAALDDSVKITNYTDPVAARWVVAICYSAVAMARLSAHAAIPANNAVYHAAGGIGCMVKTV